MSEEKKELISVRAFAKLVDVDESTIRQYIRENRLKECVEQNYKGIKKINKEVGLAEWKRIGGGLEKDKRLQPKSAGSPGADTESKPTASTDEDIPDINDSKARSEYYKAETARLEYEKLLGSLVKKADVYDALFRHAADLRSDLLSVPDKCVDDAMAAATRLEAHTAIYNAIEAVLIKHTSEGVLDKKEDEEN